MNCWGSTDSVGDITRKAYIPYIKFNVSSPKRKSKKFKEMRLIVRTEYGARISEHYFYKNFLYKDEKFSFGVVVTTVTNLLTKLSIQKSFFPLPLLKVIIQQQQQQQQHQYKTMKGLTI